MTAQPDQAARPAPTVETLSVVPGVPQIDEHAEARTIRITVPAGSPGAPPFRLTGPAYAYVLTGEIVVELEGEAPKVVKAGETFWEPGGERVHYQSANNLTDAESSYMATVFCPAGQPLLTMVSAQELEDRRDRRVHQA